MLQTKDFNEAVKAVRRASTLTETTFLNVGQSLEASIEILADLTASFEAVLADLESENLSQALTSLSRTASQVAALGKDQSSDGFRLDQLGSLTESVGGRIAQLKASLKDVDCLAVNSKIAAAHIHVPGMDFTTFAAEIGRTLAVARTTLDNLASELNGLRQHVAAARSGQMVFEKCQQEAARSIPERLSATVKSIALQHQRAARASVEARMGSARIHQRICDAVLASQIGDSTRQRLEHSDFALGLAVATNGNRHVAAHQPPGQDEKRIFVTAVHRLQAAQLSDVAEKFERQVRQITESLNSLAGEARALRSLGDSVYSASGSGGGTFILALEGQVGEALVLCEGFETARDEIARVTAAVSDATDSLCFQLRKVQSLEDDIRIMGLNTAFKCSRIGPEGLALSVIAQELRNFASGFAKEAGTLMGEVENLARITGSLAGGTGTEQGPALTEGAQAMRTSLATLRRMGERLDVAVSDLERDSERVRALLEGSVTTLQAQNEIGVVLRGVAADLVALLPAGAPGIGDGGRFVEEMLALITLEYSMAEERAVHERVFGRSAGVNLMPKPVTEPQLEEFLF